MLTWAPTDLLLGEENVQTNISYDISLTLDTLTDIITGITAEITDQNFSGFFNISVSFTDLTGSIHVSGNVPLDVFDQYSVEHIEQGFSDKNQTPIIDNLANVPDNREVFKINIDNRKVISTFLHVNVNTSAGNEAKDFEMKHRQTYDMVHTWCTNYFDTRYYI